MKRSGSSSSRSRSGRPKRVSWAPGSKLCQIADLNGAKSDPVPPGYGGSYPAKQSSKHIHVPCIRWTRPPKFVVSSNVAAGEGSEEAGTEEGRAYKVLEAFYPRSIYIPTNPFVSPDVAREHWDDTLTPIIPITIEEMDTVSETPSLEPLVDKSPGVETISAEDAELAAGSGFLTVSAELAELAAAASAIFFNVVVKSSEQGNTVDTDLLVKFLYDPETVQKFMKKENPSPEPKEASPQISQKSPSHSLPESLSLPMSSPEVPPTKSKLIDLPTPLFRPDVLPSVLKQMRPPNLLLNSEPSLTKPRLFHPPIPLSSLKRFVPVLEEKSSTDPPSSPKFLRPQIQPRTPPASPKIVLPESQHIHPPIPPSSAEASQLAARRILPSIAVSIPERLPTESKQETSIPRSSTVVSLPQPMQTSPPNPVSSCQLRPFEPKPITPPIRPSLNFPPPTPASANFSAQNQMQPPLRPPQARPFIVPLPRLDGVRAQSSTLPIQFAGPPLATSCTVPDRPTFTYNVSAPPSTIPLPIMAAERARPLSVRPIPPIPTSRPVPDRPTFTPKVSITAGPAPIMWASTARPGSALPSLPMPTLPSPPVPTFSTMPPRPMPTFSTMPAQPTFTYRASPLPSPPLFPTPLPSPTLVPTVEAARAPPVKDANYYKNLVREHGGEKVDYSAHIAPNVANQNQLQNQIMDQKQGPKEVMTPNNEKNICMFFISAKGCRKGPNCSYLHEMPSRQGSDNPVGEQSAKRTKFGG